jgi:hypothetical protein
LPKVNVRRTVGATLEKVSLAVRKTSKLLGDGHDA